MQAYIGYKYSNIPNKDEMREIVHLIANTLEKNGFETFILGRDVKKWKHVKLSNIRMAPIILKNLKKSDCLVAYIDSNAKSNGLMYEQTIAKILKKPIYYITTHNIEEASLKSPKRVMKIGSINEIENADFKAFLS